MFFAISLSEIVSYIRRECLRHPDYIPRKRWVVFDIGAYIGTYSLWVAKRVDEEGFVVTFEPNPLDFRWLISNIMLNKMKNIKALPFALGDKSSKATLYVLVKILKPPLSSKII